MLTSLKIWWYRRKLRRASARHYDWRGFTAAAEGLVRLNDRAVIPDLWSVFRSGWCATATRRAVIQKLAAFDEERAFLSLVADLTSANLEEHQFAWETLGDIGKRDDPRVTATLLLLLSSEAATRRAAAEALAQIGEPAWLPLVAGDDSDFERLGRQGGERLALVLIPKLLELNDWIHHFIETTLADLGSKSDREYSEQSRQWIGRQVEILAYTDCRPAVDALLKVHAIWLNSPNPRVLLALGRLGDPRAFPILQDALERDDYYERIPYWKVASISAAAVACISAAAKGLGLLGDRRGLAALTKVLSQPFTAEIHRIAQAALARLEAVDPVLAEAVVGKGKSPQK